MYQYCCAAILNWIPVINMKNFSFYYISEFPDNSTKCLIDYCLYSEKAGYSLSNTILYKHLVVGLMENSFDLKYKIQMRIIHSYLTGIGISKIFGE